MSDAINYEPWPELSKDAFSKTSHLLHMCMQICGKLMLNLPFDPHWANLAMPITSRGITTGVIPFQSGTFSVDIDFIDHYIHFTSTWGKEEKVKLASQSVADLSRKIFQALHNLGVHVEINQRPQEISHPIPFSKDQSFQDYNEKVVNAWWRILSSTNRVLFKYHSKFYGITPRIGLFWGTLDLRDARYKGVHLQVPKEFNLISRNAMDDSQFEVGFSASNEKYPVPSFFAFAYPKPPNYELKTIQPKKAKWVPEINEFVLDYEDLRKSKNPDEELMLFFESTYQAMAELSKWDPELVVTGKPC